MINKTTPSDHSEGVLLNLLIHKAFLLWRVYFHHWCPDELAHLEMISAIVHQLTRNLTEEEIRAAGFEPYFIDHTTGVYTQAASGVPFDAKYIGVKGDVIADLNEDLAAEQKARVTYDNLLRLIDDPDVRDPLKFLREREIVHYQRFAEALHSTQDRLDSKNFYACNPAFDKKCGK